MQLRLRCWVLSWVCCLFSWCRHCLNTVLSAARSVCNINSVNLNEYEEETVGNLRCGLLQQGVSSYVEHVEQSMDCCQKFLKDGRKKKPKKYILYFVSTGVKERRDCQQMTVWLRVRKERPADVLKPAHLPKCEVYMFSQFFKKFNFSNMTDLEIDSP